MDFKVGDFVTITNAELLEQINNNTGDKLSTETLWVVRENIKNGEKNMVRIVKVPGEALSAYSEMTVPENFVKLPKGTCKIESGSGRESFQNGDNVHHPSHYCKGGMECIDVIRAAVSNLNGFEAFCTGCAIKYLWRWKDKNGVEDLEKARTYIDMMIKEATNERD